MPLVLEGANLLLPSVETSPDPLRVSTFAEAEYGRLSFRFGKHLRNPHHGPVTCQKIVIRIPTGRRATALTTDPGGIATSVTQPPTGPGLRGRWQIVKTSTDPNEVVFDCVCTVPAQFDGSWEVGFTLSDIEVNGAIGTVAITIEEHSAVASGAVQQRVGAVKAIKGDDAFHFHSFRPSRTVFNKGEPVTLHWEGSKNAQYTMYYRDRQGVDRAASLVAPGGTWTLREGLENNTNFTLKATINSQDHYQTTHVTVNRPNIKVGSLEVDQNVIVEGFAEVHGHLTCIGLLSAKGELHAYRKVTMSGSSVVVSGVLQVHGPIEAKKDLTMSNGTLTVHGPIEAKKDVTVTNGTLTVNGPFHVHPSGEAGSANDVVLNKEGATVGYLIVNNGAKVNSSLVAEHNLAVKKDLDVYGLSNFWQSCAVTRGNLSVYEGKIWVRGREL
ncbi:hypothetical protein [Actinoalloteichus caeruleus]|uniref:hypothetical protein n=1 Tax=Actinoalloteichus cyanogriseus TaxID=2893586 RepID=UPI003BB90494